MSLFCFRILPWQEGERIDKCIVLLMDSLSRSYIQKMIREKPEAHPDLVEEEKPDPDSDGRKVRVR